MRTLIHMLLVTCVSGVLNTAPAFAQLFEPMTKGNITSYAVQVAFSRMPGLSPGFPAQSDQVQVWVKTTNPVTHSFQVTVVYEVADKKTTSSLYIQKTKSEQYFSGAIFPVPTNTKLISYKVVELTTTSEEEFTAPMK